MTIPRLSILALTLLLTRPAIPQSSGPKLEKQQPSATPTEQNEEAIQLGHPVRAQNPKVPKHLREKDPRAVLGATIKPDGTFADVNKLGGDEEFEDNAVSTLQTWQYTPATLNGEPVEAKVFISFLSSKGHVKTTIEPDLPFPKNPKTPLEEQYASGELYRVKAGEVTPPHAVFSPDPEYSEPARVAKFQGTVVLGTIINREGLVSDTWVNRTLGLGLDQKALTAVRQWKFDPATKDGKPVAVTVNVEVQFRLY